MEKPDWCNLDVVRRIWRLPMPDHYRDALVEMMLWIGEEPSKIASARELPIYGGTLYKLRDQGWVNIERRVHHHGGFDHSAYSINWRQVHDATANDVITSSK